MFWVTLIGHIRELDAMRVYGNGEASPVNQPGSAYAPTAGAFTSAFRAPAPAFYQAAPPRREKATRPDYPGFPRHGAGPGYPAPRPHASKFAVKSHY